MKNRSTDDAPKSCLPTKSSKKRGKSFRILFLRGKTSKNQNQNQNQNQNRNATTITTTTTTLSDLATLSSGAEQQYQVPRTESEFTNNEVLSNNNKNSKRHKSRIIFPFFSNCTNRDE